LIKKNKLIHLNILDIKLSQNFKNKLILMNEKIYNKDMLQKSLINIIFNYKPQKYEFENIIKNEISEFFFIFINVKENKKYILCIHKIYQLLKY